ncbi:YbaB/EbfC family nucleoid-associated protein [Micromonospora luteifusca]|uniref:YbaB/EbfC family nucleoid-associated protein n=1 Tax=Micromonospora luteifusca TaxID=709860 RepID=UPI0033A722E2
MSISGGKAGPMDSSAQGLHRVLDPEGAAEQVDAWRGRIERLAADTKTMSERLQALRVTAADSDGLVEVTVDAGGALVGLQFSQRIQRVLPRVLADTVMATVQAAKAQLAARSQQVVEETMGTDSPAARAVAARIAEQLRVPPDDTGQDGRQSDRSGDRRDW